MMNILHHCHCVVVALLFFIFIINCSHGMMSSGVFKQVTSGHRLKDCLIREKEAYSKIECAHFCLLEYPSCKSINVQANRRSSSSPINICQLNNATKSSNPENFVEDDTFSYIEPVKELMEKKFNEQKTPDEPDGCSQSYAYLTEENRKITFFRTKILSDNSGFVSGWYQVTGSAGSQLATSCAKPTGHRCNTNLPGYLNGTHPSVADGMVSQNVCFCYGNKLCYKSVAIKVQKCGPVYVYELPPASYGGRYCTE